MLYPAKRLEECKAAIDWLDPEEVSMSIADVARANASRNHLGEAQRVWAEDRMRDRITDWFGALYAPNLTGGRGRTQHRAVLQTTFRGHLRVAPLLCLPT